MTTPGPVQFCTPVENGVGGIIAGGKSPYATLLREYSQATTDPLGTISTFHDPTLGTFPLGGFTVTDGGSGGGIAGAAIDMSAEAEYTPPMLSLHEKYQRYVAGPAHPESVPESYAVAFAPPGIG